MNLKDKKLELKILITEDMAECIEELLEEITPQSQNYNEILQFKGRLEQIAADEMRGIISTENRNLALNQLRFNIITFIDLLQEVDFKSEAGNIRRPETLTTIPQKEAERLKTYIQFNNVLNQMTPSVKLSNQMSFTKKWLQQLNVRVVELRQSLHQLGYYTGTLENEEIDYVLIAAIEAFQATERLVPVDGIYGRDTHKILQKKQRTNL